MQKAANSGESSFARRSAETPAAGAKHRVFRAGGFQQGVRAALQGRTGTMFAVIRTGGKQYKVESGDTLRVEMLAAAAGEKIQFNEILMLGGKTPVVGTPLVSGAAVQAEVIEQIRGEKVIHFVKRRRKHGSKRTMGHRQRLTLLRVTEILAKGAEASGVKEAVGAGSLSAAEKTELEAKAAKIEAKKPAAKAEAPKGEAKAKKFGAAGAADAPADGKDAGKPAGKSAAKEKGNDAKPAAESKAKPAATKSKAKPAATKSKAKPAAAKSKAKAADAKPAKAKAKTADKQAKAKSGGKSEGKSAKPAAAKSKSAAKSAAAKPAKAKASGKSAKKAPKDSGSRN